MAVADAVLPNIGVSDQILHLALNGLWLMSRTSCATGSNCPSPQTQQPASQCGLQSTSLLISRFPGEFEDIRYAARSGK